VTSNRSEKYSTDEAGNRAALVEIERLEGGSTSLSSMLVRENLERTRGGPLMLVQPGSRSGAA
jgi:hypothetical protein